MEINTFYVLVASLIGGFMVMKISLNRPDPCISVSLCAISISLQDYA